MLPLSRTLLLLWSMSDAIIGDRICKVAPESPNWPSHAEWEIFNKTLGGVLLKPDPPAAACHAPGEQNLELCTYIKDEWNSSQWHSDNPVSSLWQNYNNYSCLPDGPTCTDYGYPVYVVNASSPDHVKVAVSFARIKNLRLNIKSSGHDFLGRSVQPKSLSIWTHHITSQKWHDKSLDLQGCKTSVEGTFLTAGAGSQMKAVYRAATDRGLMVVGGNSETVSLGGYLLGGGHSALSPLLGMGADQVVQIEAVTAGGQFVIANECTNSDLFWALRGGGGSTHAIATSFTIRAFPAVSVTVWTGAILGSNATSATWDAVTHIHREWPKRLTPAFASGYMIGNPYNTTGYTSLQIIMPNTKSEDDLKRIIEPIFDEVKNMTGSAVSIVGIYQFFKTYGEYLFPKENLFNFDETTQFPGNGATKLITSWLWSAEALAQPFEAVKTALKNSVDIEDTLLYNDFTAGPGTHNPPYLQPGGNAVNPAWRSAILRPAAEIQYEGANQAKLDNRHAALKRFGQALRSLAPDGGTYGNEADVLTVDFGKAFWGQNYERLVELKRKWDSEDVFWCPACVGSEGWEETADGELCRKTRA